MARTRFSRYKDIGKKDFEAREAFGAYIVNRVRNPSAFYRKLRKTGHTEKMKMFRSIMKYKSRSRKEEARRRSYRAEHERRLFED